MFFADTVVLVEGSTEQAAIRVLAERYPTPLQLDKLNCSVIEAGGKKTLPILAKVVAALGKPLLVLYDTASHLEGERAECNAQDNADIEAACAAASALVYTFDPYLEEAIGIPGASKSKQERRMREHLLTLQD